MDSQLERRERAQRGKAQQDGGSHLPTYVTAAAFHTGAPLRFSSFL